MRSQGSVWSVEPPALLYVFSSPLPAKSSSYPTLVILFHLVLVLALHPIGDGAGVCGGDGVGLHVGDSIDMRDADYVAQVRSLRHSSGLQLSGDAKYRHMQKCPPVSVMSPCRCNTCRYILPADTVLDMLYLQWVCK